jgi:anthranilate/para-aminobenzoate synthase component II
MEKVNIALSTSKDANHLNKLTASLRDKFPFVDFIRVNDTDNFYESISNLTLHGWINPGANDSYAQAGPEFNYNSWWSLPNKLTLDYLYQNVLSYTEAHKIPYFGICGGAQHMLLYHGGSITTVDGYQNHTHEITYLGEPNLSNFMTLDVKEQKNALFNCSFEEQKFHVKTFNSFAGDSNILGELELGATSDDTSVAMAYSHPSGIRTATQYHLEKFYNKCPLQTNIVDNFIKQSCMQMKNSLGEFYSPADVYAKVVERIDECKSSPSCDLELSHQVELISYQDYFEFTCN